MRQKGCRQEGTRYRKEKQVGKELKREALKEQNRKEETATNEQKRRKQ